MSAHINNRCLPSVRRSALEKFFSLLLKKVGCCGDHLPLFLCLSRLVFTKVVRYVLQPGENLKMENRENQLFKFSTTTTTPAAIHSRIKYLPVRFWLRSSSGFRMNFIFSNFHFYASMNCLLLLLAAGLEHVRTLEKLKLHWAQ
jgi:hypothetical protein